MPAPKTYARKRQTKRNVAEVASQKSRPRARRQKKTPYQGIAKYAPGAGAALGTAIGSLLGQPAIGGLLGSGAGSLVQHFVGRGEYKVVNNSFLNNGQFMEPIINQQVAGGDLFRRGEYLGDVITSSSANSFNNVAYAINPGLENSFQWLSQIACNYEEYSIEGMYFEFRSMSADALNSTNTALGQVIMSCNYNAAASKFTNKQQCENYEGGISCKPSTNCRYFVECSPHRTVLDNLYVRGGAVPSGQDQRMYDLGLFQIATNGFQGTSVNIGELWVEYQVVLRKPKLFAALGLLNSWASITTSTNTFTNLLPLGTGTPVYSPTNNIIDLVMTSTTIEWAAPSLPQAYSIMFSWNGGNVAVAFPSLTLANGLTLVNTYSAPNPGMTSGYVSWILHLSYKPLLNTANAKPLITVGTAATLPSAGTAFVVQIQQLPNIAYGL